MRFQGRIADWKDDKGFGFISPNGGGSRVFLHVSAFDARSRRPAAGDLVTYELRTDERGRPKAIAVRFVGDRATARRKPALLETLGTTFVAAALLGIVAYVVYVRFTHPNSSLQASVYKVFFARDALRANADFRCSAEKNSCSRMSSCAEAFFHQEVCRVEGMDGDRDGIPCERQWCD